MKYSLVRSTQPGHVLIIGEPKTGKTMLTAGLAAKGFKILFISCDNGLMTLFNKVPAALLESNYEFIRLPDTVDFPVAYATVRELVKGTRCHICNLHGQHTCKDCTGKPERTWTDVCLSDLGLDWIIVLDHATQVTRSAMNVYMKAIKKDPEEYKFDWDDWRRLGAMMDRIFLPIQQSLNNWVVISHVVEVELENGKKKLAAAIGTGNYARNSGGFFDHVVYCEVNMQKHSAGSSTTFSLNAITGSRSDIAIEKLLDKEGRASLVPFFDGTIPKPLPNGAAAAKSVLVQAPSVPVAPTPTPVGNIETQEVVEILAATAIEALTPQAGAVTLMHSTTTTSVDEASLKRAAMLAALKVAR